MTRAGKGGEKRRGWGVWGGKYRERERELPSLGAPGKGRLNNQKKKALFGFLLLSCVGKLAALGL